MKWLAFALVTVVTWGLYGAFLAKGAAGFHHDRVKAFLFVGVAYFLVAVLAPLAIIAANGSGFDFLSKPDGVKWSLFAGVLGAVGALTVLLALSNHPLVKTSPPSAASVVMAVVFAGAPMVAAIYGLVLKPPANGFGSLDWRFILGLVMAASGGALVTLYKPS